MESKIEFRTIPSHPEFEVSECGKVRKKSNGRLHTPCMGRFYLVVAIRLNGKPCTRLLHRLIAEAFIPNPLGKPCINHLNGDKLDNSIGNLEWCTQSENLAHAREAGLLVAGSKLKEDDIHEIRRLIASGKTQAFVAGLYGVEQGTIAAVNVGRTWKRLPKEDGLTGGRTRRKVTVSESAEILSLLAAGLSQREVGDRLGFNHRLIGKVFRGEIHLWPDVGVCLNLGHAPCGWCTSGCMTCSKCDFEEIYHV